MITAMSTALIIAILSAPFILSVVLIRAARRCGPQRIGLDQFTVAAPLAGRLFGTDGADDRDLLRVAHDVDAIRTRAESERP